ncbi:MAG: twin-arginine translocase TatA/TatE family subunit [Rhodospirillales bacterium]|nr:twin-arginine translocase TatA/TatE family subunit [Rhodospirillales bacterium]
MSPSIWQIVIVLVLALVLFGGRGKISALMGDVANGIKSFKKGMADDEVADAPAKSIPPSNETRAAEAATKNDESVKS